MEAGEMNEGTESTRWSDLISARMHLMRKLNYDNRILIMESIEFAHWTYAKQLASDDWHWRLAVEHFMELLPKLKDARV